ncbi:MAG TPA: hypothetical protein VK401_06605 [Propionibacteriaceae bacterium]|nr:hypothetical protein [Propionibacteriaceae bacterium]
MVDSPVRVMTWNICGGSVRADPSSSPVCWPRRTGLARMSSLQEVQGLPGRADG